MSSPLPAVRRLFTGLLLATLLSPLGSFAAPPDSSDAGTAAGVPAPPPSAPPAPVDASCPKGHRVQVDPQEMKKKIRAATSPALLKPLLERLGMNTEFMKLDCERAEPLSVVLDIFRARIVSADTRDFVLQTRGDICEGQLLSGVVLHPLDDKGHFCAIKLSFLPDVLSGQESRHSTTFGFENLTDPVRQVFRVDDGESESHGEQSDLSYWEAQNGELNSIFSAHSQNGVSAAQNGWYTEALVSTVEVVGKDFPRKLRLEESASNCQPVTLPSGEAVQQCAESKHTKTLCYLGASAPTYEPCD